MSAVQAYFLHRAFPGAGITLCGESSGETARIELVPAWSLLDDKHDLSVDLVLNQDSLPEVGQGTARAYIKTLAARLRGPFLSINHESPERLQAPGRTSVANLVAEVGGLRRLMRAPFLLRAGYVQELFVPIEVQLSSPRSGGIWRWFGRRSK